ncbi:MAG TPA: hypothetical protein VJ912_04080, partial [Candidatus Nanoarchaeia archaeon]|nr:hypothetical protein [Candidatus Nanoarchaeia archaeon]
MKKEVKAIILFFVVLIVAGLGVILIQSPFLINEFISNIDLTGIKNWFLNLSNNLLILAGGILLVVILIIVAMFYKKKKKKR